MIKRTKSTPRPKLESAPSKSEGVTLPPLPSKDSNESPRKGPRLLINTFVSHTKHRSLEPAFEPQVEIEALHKLFSQLMKGQEELRQKLQQQELIIEQLRAQGRLVKVVKETNEFNQGRRVDSTSRRLPAFTPRAPEESGFFTFRPSETEKEKPKFPREIFSRKSRARPC